MALEQYTINRKRPYRVHVYLDEYEYQRLNVLVANTGLSREQVLRDMINGLQVKEAPQMQFDEILRKLTRAGSNINQIATTLHAYGFVDEPKLDEVLEAIHHIEDMFYERFSTE